MRILAIGDIIGSPGRNYLKEHLKEIREKYQIDFIIANGENSSAGLGMEPKAANELFDAGVNVITLGNHTWRKKDILKIIDDNRIVRPINYLPNTAGSGCRIISFQEKKIAVINAVGRVYMEPVSNPFVEVNKKVNEIKDTVDIIIVDFHAEATSEKIAMGYYLDGRVNLVYGTHTHVQTADEKILSKGTAYITDIGMTGPYDSVIGADKFVIMNSFSTEIPEKKPVAGGEVSFNGILVEINNETNRTESIKRLNITPFSV
ncbi:MAG: TIGR00282 family metallophosphoesterase [Clostridia bacterium]|nr:TIGR00282 family metallophosphoesterase [Clostridia bacterium]